MPKIRIVLLMLASLMFASCGGGASGPMTEIDVTMSDFQFQPNKFTVPAGQEITLNATNTGAVVHSLVIMKQGQSAGDAYNDEDRPNVYWEAEVPAGGSTNTSFTAPAEPGEYEVVCHIPGHIQAGMVGKLTVVAGE